MVQVQSLVVELRSHKPCGAAKKQTNKRKKNAVKSRNFSRALIFVLKQNNSPYHGCLTSFLFMFATLVMKEEKKRGGEGRGGEGREGKGREGKGREGKGKEERKEGRKERKEGW